MLLVFYSFIDEGWKLDRSETPERYILLFAYLGETDRAIEILSNPRYGLVNNYYLAMGYLALGDIDNTFKSIEAGVENINLYLVARLQVAEWWDPIRDDPRFDEMLELLDSKITHTEQYLQDHDMKPVDQ